MSTNESQALQPVDTDDLQVYSADQDKMVRRTPEQRQKANQLMRMVEMATLVKAVALARIADGEHYLDFGCTNFKEFAEAHLPFGYRQAKKYLNIGRKFAPLLPEFEGADGQSNALLPANTPESEELERVGSMPIDRLRKLTTLDDDHFEDVVREGQLVMPDGETSYTLEELKDMKTRQYAELVEQARMDKQAYQARIQQLEEENKKLESEREADQEMVEDAEKRLDEARDLERLYGPAKRTYEANDKGLEDTDHHIRKVRQHLMNLELTPDSAQGHLNKLLELVRELNAIVIDARSYHAEAIRAAEDTIEMDVDESVIDDLIEENDVFEGDGADVEVINEDTGEVVTAGEPQMSVVAENSEEVDEERTKALGRAGWHIQRMTDGGVQLINEDAGLKTPPAQDLDAAVRSAERIEEKRKDGIVNPMYRIGEGGNE